MQSSYILENLGDLRLLPDLVGIQPVSAPIGLATALRFLYPKEPEKLNLDWSLVNGKQ